MQSRDKTTIGLTAKARESGTRIQAQEGLSDLMDVAKIAIGIAIRNGAGLDSAKDVATTWNVGTFDSDGSLRDLVRLLYETDAPYRQIEYLLNVGLESLGDAYQAAPSSTRLTRILQELS